MDSAALGQALQQVQHDFVQYRTLYNERLQDFGRDQSSKAVNSRWWQHLEQLAEQGDNADLLRLADSCNIGSLLHSLGTRLPGMARDLDKPVPTLSMNAELANCDLPGSLQRVRWWVTSNTLYRATASPSNQYPLPAPSNAVAVLERVTDFNIRTRQPGKGWRDVKSAGQDNPAGLELSLSRRGVQGVEHYRVGVEG